MSLVFPPDPVIGETYAGYVWDGTKWMCAPAPFGNLIDAPDDAAAAALGIEVGGFYRDGSVVMVRVT